jgi:hypothetical protein
MGRPINKRWFGTTGTGTGTGLKTGNNLPIRANLGAGQFEGFILKQRATRKFKVSSDDGASTGTVTLVDKVTGLSAGEGSLVGIQLGVGPKTIRKLTSHVAYDFNGVRYSWTLQDDSTETLIILTAI